MREWAVQLYCESMPVSFKDTCLTVQSWSQDSDLQKACKGFLTHNYRFESGELFVCLSVCTDGIYSIQSILNFPVTAYWN